MKKPWIGLSGAAVLGAALMAAVACRTGPAVAWADDGAAAKTSPGDKAAPRPAEAPSANAQQDEPPPTPDAAFDRYVSASDIGEALDALDAAALTDAALQLAEGERVLLRKHKSGLTAAGLAAKAADLAARRGDRDTLARIRRAADRLGGDAFQAKLTALDKLASAARSPEPGLLVQADDATPQQFTDFRDCLTDLETARLLGDRAALHQLQLEVVNLAGLSRQQVELVKGRAAAYEKDMPEQQDATDRILGRLGASSRGWGIANTPFDPGTWKDVDPTNKNSSLSQAVGNIRHVGEGFPGDGGTPGFVGNTPRVQHDPITAHFAVNNACNFPVRVQFEPGGQTFTFPKHQWSKNLTRISYNGAQPSVLILSTNQSYYLENANFRLSVGKDGNVQWHYE